MHFGLLTGLLSWKVALTHLPPVAQPRPSLPVVEPLLPQPLDPSTSSVLCGRHVCKHGTKKPWIKPAKLPSDSALLDMWYVANVSGNFRDGPPSMYIM